MAITDVNGVVAGMQPPVNYYKAGPAAKAAGAFVSFWRSAGFPGSAGAVTGGTAGTTLTASVTGQIPFKNPVSGNSYLARFTYTGTQVGAPILCDRLWEGGGISPSTTATQPISPTALPPRDMNGASVGSGVMLAIEYGVAAGNAATNAGVIYYTNTLGSTNRVASWTGIASALIMQFVPCTLQAGDTGVSSITGIVLQVSNTGASMNLVLYRPLAHLQQTLANSGTAVDAVTGGFVRMYDGTVPFIIQQCAATTAPTIAGQVIVTQG